MENNWKFEKMISFDFYAGGISMLDHLVFGIPTFVLGWTVFGDPCGLLFNPWVFIRVIGGLDLLLSRYFCTLYLI